VDGRQRQSPHGFLHRRAGRCAAARSAADHFHRPGGGWPAGFAAKVGEKRGLEFVPITFEVAPDLAFWRAEIPGRVVGRAEALAGPTTPPGKRVQTINPPGSEVGPGQIATWGRSTELRNEGFGFKWTGNNWSSKHIPFDWTGPA
jgi:hypothetical protein